MKSKQRGRRRLAAEQAEVPLMAHRLAPEAEADLEELWFYVARTAASRLPIALSMP